MTSMFSWGVDRALHVAVEAHQGQFRKGPELMPYAVHPVHVGMILIRWGADEEVIQAGLLHDVVEDCEGWTVERLRDQFGERVASIVAELSEDKSLSWKERKRIGIEHVPELSNEAALVKAADQLHNLRSLVAALGTAEDPDALWARFSGGREGTLRVAVGMVEALAERVQPSQEAALREALEALRRPAAGS